MLKKESKEICTLQDLQEHVQLHYFVQLFLVHRKKTHYITYFGETWWGIIYFRRVCTAAIFPQVFELIDNLIKNEVLLTLLYTSRIFLSVSARESIRNNEETKYS